MKFRRKVFALVMSAVLVLTLMPAMVFATDSGASAVKPVKATFSGDMRGVIGTDTDNLYTDNFGFYISYSDGSEKFFEYGTYSFKDSKGKTYKRQGFKLEGASANNESSFLEAFIQEGSKPRKYKEGYNPVKIVVKAPYAVSGAGTSSEVSSATTLYTSTRVLCSVDRPVKVKFVPAKGFKPNVDVGYNYVNEESFYGKGNVFEVTYKYRNWSEEDKEEYGTYVAEYQYVRKKVSGGVIEGFYDNGNTDYKRFELFQGADCILKKGTNKVKLTYTEYPEGTTDPVKVKFTVNVKAAKLNAFSNWPIVEYTGKTITRKALAKQLVVRDSRNKKVPSSAYTISLPKSKKMGWHTVKVRFNDKKKYVSSISVDYGIGPHAPKLTNVKAGSGQLTVNWKKLTTEQLKNIDGAYIEYATDKTFYKDLKRIKVTKKQLKKNSKIIKKLKKNKKYYVRMYTYKMLKDNGEKYEMWSHDSNVMNKKTR